MLQQRAKAYINGPLFVDYIQRVFIPHLTSLRQQQEFAQEEAALLMDNCPSHIKQEAIGLLTAARMRIITFALTQHTSFKFLI
jgi:hypothetical protein